MSTIFCNKFVSYLIHSKHFMPTKSLRETFRQPLTDPWVSKACRSHLYCSGTYGQVFKHVLDRLDASQPNNWCLHRLTCFPDEPQRNRFDRWAGKPTTLIPESRLSGAYVDG